MSNATLKDDLLDIMRDAFVNEGVFEFWPQQFTGNDLELDDVVEAMGALVGAGLLVEHATVISGEGVILWEGPRANFPARAALIEYFRDEHGREPELDDESEDIAVQPSYELNQSVRRLLQPPTGDARTRELGPQTASAVPAPVRPRLAHTELHFDKHAQRLNISVTQYIYAPGAHVGNKNSYNSYGQTGAMGDGASASDTNFYVNTWQQHAATDLTVVAKDLKKIIDALQKEPQKPENVSAITILEAARRAAESLDGPVLMKHLKALPAFVIKLANVLGISAAAQQLITAVGGG